MRFPSLSFCIPVLALIAAAPSRLWAEEVKDSPSASQAVPIKLGSVDAVGGRVSLRVPLGPTLPGRIPVGFMWSLTTSGQRSGKAGPNVGGAFRPVEWPEDIATSGMALYTVLVNGEAWSFLPHTRLDNAQLPTTGQVRAWMSARGVDEGQAEALDYAQQQSQYLTFVLDKLNCSSDGTRFYAVYHWDVARFNLGRDIVPARSFSQRHVVLHGQSAIWSNGPAENKFTNTWGDQVTVAESWGQEVNQPGAPRTIKATNKAGQWVQLDVTVGSIAGYWTDGIGIVDSSATLSVTTNLPLPTATLEGRYRSKQRGKYNDSVNPYRGIWDAGFLPTKITHRAGGESRVTLLEWGNPELAFPHTITLAQVRMADGQPNTTYLPVQGIPAIPLKITHPEGIQELFTYGHLLDLGAFSFSGGVWNGFWPFAQTEVGSESMVGRQDLGVSLVQFVEPGGLGRAVRFGRKYPTCITTSSVQQWPKPDHETAILNFPTSSPTASSPYRGLHLFHVAGGSWGSGGVTPAIPDPSNPQAFLFGTSTIQMAKAIHGSGVDVNGMPSGGTVDQTTIYDGWDLKSWANPDGSLAAAGRLGLPVTPVALRTRIFTPGLPTKTILAGTTLTSGVRDDRGPLRTDEVTEPPAAAPESFPTPAIWSSQTTGPTSGSIHRVGVIARHWNNSLLALQTDTDTKSLDGSSLPDLRGTGSVNFGTSSYGYDGSGRVTSITGTRGAFTTTETRSYLGGTPLVLESTKTLSGGAGGGIIALGKSYSYDSSPHHWLTGEKDKIDGRWTTYVPDQLGRVTSVTDVLGVVTTTAYDDWGRVREVKRLAMGGFGEAKTTTTYDVNGGWKVETTSVDGRTLTTRTDFDAWGRPVKVTLPDGSTQTTYYNAWGQKDRQSPVLKPGMVYGDFTWTYDDKGRVWQSFDRGGSRLLSEVTKQPAWGSVGGVSGIVSTIKDDRGLSRSTITDLLGQKAGVVDQAGQASTYTYDKDGHLLTSVQGGQTRTYTYNDMGWLTSRTEPEEGRTDFSNHTMLGLPLTTTQKGRSGSANTTTTLSLNAWMLPSTITTSGLGGTVRRTVTYDPATHLVTGLQETQRYGTLTENYAYDGLFRVRQKTIGDGVQSFTVARTLDASGNLTQLKYPAGGGHGVSNLDVTYDSFLRPLTVKQDGQLRASMDYGTASGSAVTSILTYGNGASTRTTTDSGEISRVLHQGSNYSQGRNLVWTAGGLLTSRTDTGNLAMEDAFQYDNLQRLTGATTFGLNGADKLVQNFTYDRYGNRTSSGATYTGDPANKPVEALGWTATYDATNSLPTSVLGTGGLSLDTSVQYDALGRMTQVWAIPGQSSTLVSWGYDASGRVVSEGGESFLLDSEGLRFKRTRADRSQVYTVYGFGREPLAVFETAPGSAPMAPANAPAATNPGSAEAPKASGREGSATRSTARPAPAKAMGGAR